jgi:hypothetical protein
MKLQDLFERGEQDVQFYSKIDEVRQDMYGYLYNSLKKDPDFKMPVAELQGQDYPCLAVKWIKPVSWFSRVLVIFKKTDFGGGGFVSPVKMQDFDHIVSINVWDDTPKGIMNSLHADRTVATFKHEFTHILDLRRLKNAPPTYTSSQTKDENGGYGEKERADYSNHPLELNAYFANLAEPLLDRLSLAKKEGLEVLGLYDPLPRPFDQYLLKLPSLKYGTLKHWWAVLTPENKKKLIRRLYDLYTRCIKNEDEAIQSEK